MKNYSNKTYYRTLNSDVDNQFDTVETTISHLFRFPHSALNNLPYGAAFCREVLERRLLAEHETIIEIGGGLGNFAYDFLVQLNRENCKKKYIVMDICPKLQEKQKSALKDFSNVSFYLMDAENLPFDNNKVNALVINNEVIADLDSVEMTIKEAKESNNEEIKVLLEFVSETEENIIFNTGSVKFIKELNRILTRGSNVVITEHGLWEKANVAITGQWNNKENSHIEYSINWKYLYYFAETLGFNCEILPLIDFLHFDKGAEVTNFNDARALRTIYPDFPIAAIPASFVEKILNLSLQDIRTSCGLKLPAIGSENFPDDQTLPFYKAFQVLILKKE